MRLSFSFEFFGIHKDDIYTVLRTKVAGVWSLGSGHTLVPSVDGICLPAYALHLVRTLVFREDAKQWSQLQPPVVYWDTMSATKANMSHCYTGISLIVFSPCVKVSLTFSPDHRFMLVHFHALVLCPLIHFPT